ncbi:AAA family ATPase [Lentzea sp. NPDC054927]
MSNFRSIRDEQEVSLMRSRRIAAHSKNDAKSGDPVSTVVGLYGGNASGKSNILNALIFMKRMVLDSHSQLKPDGGTYHDPFILDQEHGSMSSRFEVELMLNGTRFQYGFELDGKIINSEWLYAFPHVRRQTWFERDASLAEGGWYFGREFKGRNRVIAELTRPNSLFLSTAVASKHETLAPVYSWFSHQLGLADPHNLSRRMRFTFDQIEQHPESVPQIKRLLKSADLGICDVEVQRREVSPEYRDTFVRLTDAVRKEVGQDHAPPVLSDEEIDHVLRDMTSTIELKHACAGDSPPIGLPMEEESLGTQSLLGLSGPIMHALRRGVTLLVDEIDTSLHPHLVAEIVKLFKSPEHNHNHAQLIFTSHDTSLLGNLVNDEPILERDQVWLVQKDRSGASEVYPLTDFTPRRMENLERGYLQGRYGAVPFIKSNDLVDAFMKAAENLTRKKEDAGI